MRKIVVHQIRHIHNLDSEYMIVIEDGEPPWQSLLLTKEEFNYLISQGQGI